VVYAPASHAGGKSSQRSTQCSGGEWLRPGVTLDGLDDMSHKLALGERRSFKRDGSFRPPRARRSRVADLTRSEERGCPRP